MSTPRLQPASETDAWLDTAGLTPHVAARFVGHFAMPTLRHELGTVLRLSVPVVLAQLGLMLMGVVDTLMLSHLGVTALAASAVGNAWQWTWMSFGMGLVLGIDPQISQAHGRGDGAGTAIAFQRGVILALLISVPIGVGLLLTRTGLTWLGQEPVVADLAARYNLFKLPTVPGFLVYTALRQYLQGRGLMTPATWVIWGANLFHALLNWVLIFGHAGVPALGIEGAAIASSFSTWLMLGSLALGVWRFQLHAGAWQPWGRACVEVRGFTETLRLGLPVGMQLALETCAFACSTLMAGWLGRAALASHQIVLNLAALSFMVPLGVSQGAATRVGNLIGAGDRVGMRRAVRAALILGAGVMSVSALAFIVLRFQLPRLYSEDQEVVLLAARIFPLAAAFQLCDGTQVVAGGVLRGMGRPDAAALVNLVGYYVFALPLGYLLGFVYGQGLPGIWISLAAGLTVVALSLLVWTTRTATHLPFPARASAT
jgi:MATE family multidrug resistance protein